jgi:hypothetical protein
MKYILIGGPFEVYDTQHSGEGHLASCTLGGEFEMDQALAERAIVEGAALLPASAFEALPKPFTAEELKRYPNPRLQAAAPPDFHEKLLAARIALHDFRQQLIGAPGAPPKEA